MTLARWSRRTSTLAISKNGDVDQLAKREQESQLCKRCAVSARRRSFSRSLCARWEALVTAALYLNARDLKRACIVQNNRWRRPSLTNRWSHPLAALKRNRHNNCILDPWASALWYLCANNSRIAPLTADVHSSSASSNGKNSRCAVVCGYCRV